MEYKISDSIGIFKNAFSDEYCDSLINSFDTLQKAGFTRSRQALGDMGKLSKDDDSYSTANISMYESEGAKGIDSSELESINSQLGNEFNNTFWGDIYPTYAGKFSVLSTIGHHSIYSQKVQKTVIGGGYHIWHCEQGNRSTSNRIMAFILYLNDVEDGGETEFLYLSKRVKPRKGTLVLFPAAFTHTHRGNPPLSGSKYIATGWIEF